MVRASIAASPGVQAGMVPMKKRVSALAVLVAAVSCSAAFAQEMSFRDVDRLAMNTSEPGAGHSTLIEASDSGGGSRTASGGDGMRPVGARADEDDSAVDALPVKATAPSEPTTPAAAVPKRPSYRWQSLVPGAIK